MTRVSTFISDQNYHNIFNQLLIFINLYQHAKNQLISTLCSGDIFDSNILQSDWPRAFWPISQEPDFPQIWDLCRNIANNFIIDQIQEKLTIKFFNKLRKIYSWPIFPVLVGKKSPPPPPPKKKKTFGSLTHIFIWVSYTMPQYRQN